MKNFLGLFPSPPSLQSRSRVYDLKSRLDWGEPALTIIDVRDRSYFNASHILGAISIPTTHLTERAMMALELSRDLYVYGETDDETATAAATLRQAGYCNVSELRGGMAAWRAVGYPIESTAAALA